MALTALQKLALGPQPNERKDVNFKLEDVLIVDGSNNALNFDIWGSVTGATIDWTINGASTVIIQVEDEDEAFINDPILQNWAFGLLDVSVSSARSYATHSITRATYNSTGDVSDYEWILGQRPIDLNLNGIWFRLCGIKGEQDVLTLTFEDRVASLLRDQYGKALAVTRGQFTRAEFIQMLCNQVKSYGGIQTFIPELSIVQPITTSTALPSAADLRSSSAGGVTVNEGLQSKGVDITQSQANNINAVLAVAVSVAAPMKAQIALIEACIQESNLMNLPTGTADSVGILQVRKSVAGPMGVNPMDIAAVANAFLTVGYAGNGGAINLALGNSKWSAGQVALAVQAPEKNNPAQYDQWQAEATKIVNAYAGVGVPGAATQASMPGPYEFTRGANEDSWDCIQRLAQEVQWYAFVRENVLWFVSGNYLWSQMPQMVAEKGKNGVQWINPDLDVGARDRFSQLDIVGEAQLWTALPGMAVNVVKKGPATGMWVVSEVTLDMLDESNLADITVQKPLPARREPASTEITTTSGGAGTSQSAQAAYNAALQLSNMHLPYLWGGGHQPNGLVNVHAGGPGLDCSGSVCWVLHQAGMFTPDTAIVSGDFNTWGLPGPGAQMTVWYSADHVFIEFNLQNFGHQQLNTVSPDGGPQLYPWGPPGGNTSGMQARHWINT